jgi:hypothetical protein
VHARRQRWIQALRQSQCDLVAVGYHGYVGRVRLEGLRCNHERRAVQFYVVIATFSSLPRKEM